MKAKDVKELLERNGVNAGVKAFEHDNQRYVVLWTSNAFKDREQETFKTKAWEEYVARRDARGSHYDRVWFWHMKGTDFADVVWEDMVGRMLVDVARIDNTALGDKMWHAITHPEEYPDVAPMGWGTSHGFAYPASAKRDGVYDFVEKFETTVLPYHRASNLYGGVKEVVNMAVTKEKVEALTKLVGQELAEQTLKDAEKATSVLEQAGISFKDDSAVEDEVGETTEDEIVDEDIEAEIEAEEEEDEDAEDTDEDDDLYELEVTDELVKEIAANVDVSTAVKEAVGTTVSGLKEAILAELTPVITNAINAAITEMEMRVMGQKEAVVQQALSGKIKLTPFSATQSGETIVRDAQVQASKEAKSGRKQKDVVANVVQNMLAGKI